MLLQNGNVTDEEFLQAKEAILSDLTIIDDSYNSSYESLSSALDVILETKFNGNASVLIGDIFELGDRSEQIHYEIGKLLASANLKYIFLLGKHIKSTARGAIDYGFEKECIFIYDLNTPREIIAKHILNKLTAQDALLAKASHGVELKSIIEIISRKK